MQHIPSARLASLLVPFFFLLCAGAAFAADDMEGKASWYGTSAHGKRTANGEKFDRQDLSAAHRTLPFGSVVRVYNLGNGRQILVRVTDRGPFAKGRVIDVSRRAGAALRMLRSGTARVALETVGNAQGKPLNADSAFYVHLADVAGARKAHALSYELEKELGQSIRALFSVQATHPAIALCLGPYPDFPAARAAFLAIEKKRATLGVIEGPATGGDIPRHVPPKSSNKKLRQFTRTLRAPG